MKRLTFEQWALLLYAIGLWALGVFYLLRWPIVAADTDLWFHLSHGQYLFEHHRISDHSYFSFITPPRLWLNYAWLFQAILYVIYTWWGGYYGLLVFRAAMYAVTMALIARYLYRTWDRHRVFSWPIVLFTVYCMVMILRDTLLRPHLLTYALISAFLLLLEFPTRVTLVLPLLAIVWCNVHGVMYPILILLAGVYVLEHFLTRLRGDRFKTEQLRTLLLPATLSCLAIYLTPHGTSLIPLPFVPKAYIQTMVREFRLLTPPELSSIHITEWAPTYLSVFNLLLAAAGLSALTAIIRRRLKVSHWILFLAGVFLLQHGVRFFNECSLLSLPILAANPPLSPAKGRGRMPVVVRWTVIVMLMAMPVAFLGKGFERRSRYPLSARYLPEGVAAFLTTVDVGGTVLNEPNFGGYLRWALYPRYKIFIDLEGPMYFTNADFYQAINAFADKGVLGSLIDQYRPTFIAGPMTGQTFRRMMSSFSHYVPVFVDDAAILYVDQEQQRALAEHYRLNVLAALRLDDEGGVFRFEESQRGPALEELTRLTQLYPHGRIANYLAGTLLCEQGKYDEARVHAEAVLRTAPDSPLGYQLLGDVWKGLGMFDRAVACYRRALKREEGEAALRGIYRNIGLICLKERRFQRAYRALRKGVQPYDARTPVEDLCLLGYSAFFAGKREEGAGILRFTSTYRAGGDTAACGKTLKAELAHGAGMVSR